MTMVVVGGGPTGVELAGALAELKRHALPHDFPNLDLSEARVILLEASDYLLAPFPKKLRAKALDQLRQLGVEIRLGASVIAATADGVELAGGDTIAVASVVWVAGVRGDPLGERIGAELGPGRRAKIDPALRVPGRPNTHVIGDLACLDAPEGRPYPMLAQVAMQQGELAAQNILRDLRGEAPRTFRYRDRGTMATIGRRMAVAHIFGLQLSGFVAWVMWLAVHLTALIGLRNRALVLVNWTWNYVRYDRANRIITDSPPAEPGPPDNHETHRHTRSPGPALVRRLEVMAFTAAVRSEARPGRMPRVFMLPLVTDLRSPCSFASSRCSGAAVAGWRGAPRSANALAWQHHAAR